MIEAGLVAARFIHFVAMTFLLGAAWAPTYAHLQSVARPLRLLERVAAWLALLSGVGWFLLALAGMAGSLSAALEPRLILSTMRDMLFGQVTAARLIGCMVLVHFVHLNRSHARWPRLVLSGALLGSIALTGHAQAEEGTAQLVHVLGDALHLIAAGVWLGALGVFALLFVAGPASEDEQARRSLLRFSATGIVAVLVLIATGAVNSWFLVGTPMALVQTPYGRLLLAKLLLFLGMLALAGVNRRDLRRGSVPLATLRTRLLVEQACGLAVLMIVALLGTLAPPGLAA